MFQEVSILAAFLAGLISFVSPCVLPLMPIYLSYLTGSSMGTGELPGRSFVMSHALLFVGGFTLIFVVVFGVPVGVAGMFIRGSLSEILVQIGGVFLVLLGLHMAGFFRFLAERGSETSAGKVLRQINDRLDMLILPERRLQYGQSQSPSYMRSFLIGMTFAAGWTPCVGPILGAISTLAFNGQNLGLAVFLLFIYSMGLAVPFLLMAFFLSSATGTLRRINRHAHAIEMVSAIFLVGIGVLLVSGQFAVLNTYFNQLVPPWLIEYL